MLSCNKSSCSGFELMHTNYIIILQIMHVSLLHFTTVNHKIHHATKLVGVVLQLYTHASCATAECHQRSSKMSMDKYSTLLVVCCVLLTCTLVQVSWGLKIGAFNIQTFGPTKMGKPDVVASLVQVKDS